MAASWPSMIVVNVVQAVRPTCIAVYRDCRKTRQLKFTSSSYLIFLTNRSTKHEQHAKIRIRRRVR